jgi:hypothetical protein
VSALDERQKVLVERCGVKLSALNAKCDGAAPFVDAIQRYGGFADATALAHKDKPLLAHPIGHGFELVFNAPLILSRNLELLFRGCFSRIDFATGISVCEPSTHRLGHEDRKVYEAEPSCVVLDSRKSFRGLAPVDESPGYVVGK